MTNKPAESSEFIKSYCPKCGDSYEFPISAEGMTFDCPHCKAMTLIYMSQPFIKEAPQKKSEILIDYFKTSDGEVLCRVVKSPNLQFVLLWCDRWAAGKDNEKGSIYLFFNESEIFKCLLERPNDGQVADNGSFVICDWRFSNDLSSVFYAFNSAGAILIKKAFKANLLNCAISQSGEFAACQTAENKDSSHGDLLTLFDLRAQKEVWHITPPLWPETYEFNVADSELIIAGSSMWSPYKACVLKLSPSASRKRKKKV